MFELPLPPRRVKQAALGVVGIWLTRLFVMPHTLVGLGLIGFFLLNVANLVFGNEVEGAVVSGGSTRSKNTAYYYFTVDYQIDREHFTTQLGTSRSEFEELLTPNGVPKVPFNRTIHRVRVFGYEYADQNSGGFGLLCIVPFMLFWNFVVGSFVYALWVKPMLMKRLVRHGTETRGTVLSTRTVSGKSTTYKVTYEYQDELLMRHQREDTVPSAAEWNSLKPGGSLCVIYDPKKPARAVAYACSGYQVVDDVVR